MFPNQLDGANVLYYTDKGNYGTVKYENGKIAHRIFYIAICQYNDDKDYYLFLCDESLDVVSDSVWSSLEQCMSIAKQQYGSIHFNKYDF